MIEILVVVSGKLPADKASDFLDFAWGRHLRGDGRWYFDRSFDIADGGWEDFSIQISALTLNTLAEGHIDFGLVLPSDKPMISLRLSNDAMRQLAAANISSQVSVYAASD